MIAKPASRMHVLIIIVCIGLTTSAALSTYSIAQRRAEAAYQSVVDDSRSALLTRINAYLLSLNGLAAFMGASSSVTEEDWASYVEALDIDRTLPGVLGLGLVQPTTDPGLIDLMESVRANGESELVVHPQTGRPDKMIIRFIEPAAQNAGARGLDISFEEIRRSAAILARGTGQTQMTGPIELVQGGQEAWGALLLRPIYNVSPIPADRDERLNAHVGWVYAPFLMREALSGLTSSQAELFGVTVSDNGQTIFQTAEENTASRFTRSENIDIYGRTWALTWSSSAQFDGLHRSFVALLVMFGGLGTTGLLWLYLRMQANREDEINTLVARKTSALSDRVRQNRAIIENSVFGVMHLDGDGVVGFVNLAATAILGQSKPELLGRTLEEVMTRDEPNADIAAPQVATSFNHGCLRKLEIQINVWNRSNGTPVQSVLLRDITEETFSRQTLSAAEQRWNMAMEGAEIGVFDVDLKTNTSIVSDTWRDLMGVPRDVALDTQAHFFSRVHPEDLPILHAADRAAICGTTPRSISEFRVMMNVMAPLGPPARFSADLLRYVLNDVVSDVF